MKICVIKLGAKGDVVRTLPILVGIKKKYPDSEITWITKKNTVDLLKENPYIKKVISSDSKIDDKFDILYNLDINEEAYRISQETKADKKLGFYSEGGYPAAFNKGAEYYINTIFDDELKKKNKKTYQEMIFEAAELPYEKEFCSIYLNANDLEYGENFVKENGINKNKLIGIHIGSSPRWLSKAWAEEKIIEFIKRLKAKNYEILLFGGPDEVKKHKKIVDNLKAKGIDILRNNPDNTNREFASLVNICKKIVCGDSFALHVSLALKKPTICLFFCTSPYEVEDYGLLKKIVSPKLYDFFPQRQDEYNEGLVNSISVDEVLMAVEEN